MRKIIALIFLFALFLPLKAFSVAGNVVINELLPHPSSGNLAWVELYNPLDSPVNINNWTLKNDNPTNNIVGRFNLTLDAKSFVATEAADNKLANNGDTIKLFDSGNNEVDSIQYTSDPGIDKSIGRSVDGGETIIIFSSPTKGYSNVPPTPTPTPTETPTAIPTPTPTPTPPPTPTETPTPTATVTPTPTPTPTILPSPSSTLHPTPTPINYQEIFEKRMICRFSYNRLRRLPNAEYFINLLRIIFGPQSVCHP